MLVTKDAAQLCFKNIVYIGLFLIFFKKLIKCQQNYSTIEKECLALLLALQHFDVYLNVTVHPILVLINTNQITTALQFCINCQTRIKDLLDASFYKSII